MADDDDEVDEELDDEDDGGSRRPRLRFRAAAPIALIAFAAGAMVGAFLGSGGSPLRIPAEPNFQGAPLLDLGQAATSSRGNSITALSWDPDAKVEGIPGRVGQAEVLWCAGQRQQGDYGRIAELWRVEMTDATRADVAPSAADGSLLATPHLVTRAGDCMRGTVEFVIPDGAVPKFLQFGGQEIFKWNLAATARPSPRPAA